MLTTLVYLAIAFVAVSFLAMAIAMRGTENTFQLIGAIAHGVAAVSVGQYLIWPAQAYAMAMTIGVLVLAVVNAGVFGYMAYRRLS